MGSRAVRAAFALPLVAGARRVRDLGRQPGRPRHRRVDAELSARRGRRAAGRQHKRDGSTSKGPTARPSRCAPSGSPRRPPTPAPASCCRASRSTRTSARAASRSRPRRMEGFMLGAAVEVRYHVKAPKGAIVERHARQRAHFAHRAERQGHGPHVERRGHRRAVERAGRRRNDQRRGPRRSLGGRRTGDAAHHERRRAAHAAQDGERRSRGVVRQRRHQRLRPDAADERAVAAPRRREAERGRPAGLAAHDQRRDPGAREREVRDWDRRIGLKRQGRRWRE